VAVLIVVVALCWVLRDEDRSRRLVQIIYAWRVDRTRACLGGRQERRAASFTAPGLGTPMAAAGFLVAGAVGAVIGAAAGSAKSGEVILCVTCGKRFRQG
jgi:hypothetical protein